jgi:hypothetical protein
VDVVARQSSSRAKCPGRLALTIRPAAAIMGGLIGRYAVTAKVSPYGASISTSASAQVMASLMLTC